MKVKVKKLYAGAVLPSYATVGSGCFDIYVPQTLSSETVHVSRGYVFSTGLSFEVPDGHVMLVFSRSGHGFNQDTRLANCVGVIDSDYRGELKVKLRNDGEGLTVKAGDRIAQALILPVERIEFEEAQELSSSARGSNGFGSTGN